MKGGRVREWGLSADLCVSRERCVLLDCVSRVLNSVVNCLMWVFVLSWLSAVFSQWLFVKVAWCEVCCGGDLRRRAASLLGVGDVFGEFRVMRGGCAILYIGVCVCL